MTPGDLSDRLWNFAVRIGKRLMLPQMLGLGLRRIE